MKSPFEIYKRTLDGKLLLSGCFRAKDEFGIPIDVIVEICGKNNLFVDWNDYITEAAKQSKMESAFKDMEYSIGTELANKFKDIWTHLMMV
jgi:alanyl-tRNA synthetase